MFKKIWKFLTGKNKTTQIPSPSVNESGVPGGKRVFLWATFYYSKVLSDTKNPNDVALLDMNGKKLGPTLSQRDWCLAGIEGTAIIDGIVYNYAGNTGKSQTACSLKATETVRWMKSPYMYGVGSRNNELRPFYSLATDPKVIPFGTIVFIPEAVGVKYFLEGEERTHDGYFRADDVGGAIKGNHIDVFIGNVSGGLPGATKANPFAFIKSDSSKTFYAVLGN